MKGEGSHSMYLVALLVMSWVLLLSAFSHAVGEPQRTESEISIFGINGLGFFHQRTSPYVWDYADQATALLKEMGVKWVRFDFWWGVIEPVKGQFNWEFADKVIDYCARNGISMLPILCYNSAWSGGMSPATDQDRADFAEFVYQVVNRYGDRVKYWEIWNEPNIPAFWKPRPDVRNYALLLSAAYDAAKRANPDAKIVGAATSEIDMNFIKGIDRFGAWDKMDAISIHPYSMADGPMEMGLERQLEILKEFMNQIGKPKPIWITEVGWRQPASDPVGERQGKYLFETYVISMAQGVDVVFWFCLRDFDSARWGVVAGSGAPWVTPEKKKSFEAYQTVVKYLDGAHFLGYLKGKNLHAYVFTKEGEPIIAAWADRGQKATLTLAGQLEVVAYNGENLSEVNGTIEVTDSPVIILGAAPSVVVDVVPTRPIDPGANLLVNPSFEMMRSENPEQPYGWSQGTIHNTNRQGKYGVSSDAYDGNVSLSLTDAGDAIWNSFPIPVVPGERYELTGRIKAARPSSTNCIRTCFWDGTGWGYIGRRSSNSVDGTTEWTPIRLEVTVPEGAFQMRVELASSGRLPGTVWFDDLYLRRIE